MRPAKKKPKAKRNLLALNSGPTQVILGITGGIAAYKIPELIRSCRNQDIEVNPIMTTSALEFVTATTIATVAESAPLIKNGYEEGIAHLANLKNASCFVIAPATANTIAKCAHGIADNSLTAAFLAYQGPKLIVPAMHTEMWENPITQANVATLKSYGVEFLGPVSGPLACGDVGAGRMIDTALILAKIQLMQLTQLDLSNKTILITSGGTQEPIDSIRTITNASTGKLGNALATTAALAGAQVTLLSTTPHESALVTSIHTPTVQSMEKALEQSVGDSDALIMAAAVSDFTPSSPASQKLKRDGDLTLQLTPTKDLLANVPRTENQLVVGFCLESESNLTTSAQEKLTRKNCDYIIANTPDAIGQDHRSFTIVGKNGQSNAYENISLMESAHAILSLV
jgi:phosphopantothenoylcysteine decarboxylase / phosphopantothenate---cysteine ligase